MDPIKKTPKPILQNRYIDALIDMWEHPLWITFAKDAKKKYVESMMRIIDWEQINQD